MAKYMRSSFRVDVVRYWVYGKTEAELARKQIEKENQIKAAQITSNSTVRQWAEV